MAALRRLAGRPIVRRTVSAAFFCGAVWLIVRQLGGMSLHAFLAALAATEPLAVAGSLVLTGASYLCLSGSEWLALHALGHRLPYRRAARVAIPAYALTNTAGFSPATGTAIRIELYRRVGLSVGQSAAVAMVAGAAVTLAGVATAGAVLAVDPSLAAALHLGPPIVARLLGGLLMTPLVLWFVAFRRGGPKWLGGVKQVRLSPRERGLGLCAGLGDWLFSGGAMFLLLPHHEPAAFGGFFFAYVVGCLLSAATGVPGGIGVFEAIVLALGSLVARTHETAAALLLYRVIYSVLPLTLATLYGLARRLVRTLASLGPRGRAAPK